MNSCVEKFPARIHILLARESHTGLVIRRGPAKRVAIFGWDRKTNEFKLSQWFKGRIYERRCDLAPDGEHWIYMAMNGKWGDKSYGAWTAIARAPWLKAIVLYSKGSCWNGGGLFVTHKSYWLNRADEKKTDIKSTQVREIKEYKLFGNYGGECPGVYYNRLQRDGWRFMNDPWEDFFEKQISPNWILRKHCHADRNHPAGKGCYWDEHQLINSSEEIIKLPGWEQAEWADGSLYFAKDGCLYKCTPNDNEIGQPELLHDFNNYKFETKRAPY